MLSLYKTHKDIVKVLFFDDRGVFDYSQKVALDQAHKLGREYKKQNGGNYKIQELIRFGHAS